MKVVVVGASAAGLYSAYLLARAGFEVEVLEKGESLGWPPRTLIVTSKLNDVLGFEPEEAVVNRVKYLELFSGKRSVRLELGSPDLVLERKKLLVMLARMAEEAGVRLWLGHEFRGYEMAGNKILLYADVKNHKQRVLATDVLVGADGVRSGVVSAFNQVAGRNGHRLTSIVQARVKGKDCFEAETCEVWFNSKHTRYFYWLIPESAEAAALGLIAEKEGWARECLMKVIEERGFEAMEFQASMVPLHRFRIRKGIIEADRNVFFIGDAAAQVKATTVGGMVTGLQGAGELADYLLNGGYSSPLKAFRKFRGLKLELDLHLLVRHLLNHFRNEDYDELIDLLAGRLKVVLERWTRDELSGYFWRLILSEPRLIKLGARALLRTII